ncbi:MAG: hypothetical protein IPH13_10550 [Planctomycetes bacterium]|nr:hypothetical protein [Planctomycetota bacterium]MCC7173467.1 hypothetical protein [Planctomycetota bacterium]
MTRIATIVLAAIAVGLRVVPFLGALRGNPDAETSLLAMGEIAAFALVVPFVLLRALAPRDATERVLVLALIAFDPLSIAAVYGASAAPAVGSTFVPGADAAIGSALCAAVACVVLVLRAPSARARRIGVGLGILAASAAALFALRHAPGPCDALFLAWSDFGPSACARLYAVVHHSGYALVPLALWTLAGSQRRPFLGAAGAAVLGVVLADRLTFSRFAALSAFAPVLVAAAAHAVLELRRAAASASEGNLRAFGLVLVILAVNAPVLASDALTHGPRLPRVVAPSTSPLPVFTTAPESFTDTRAKNPPSELPAPAELDAILARPFRILLPIVNGRLWRGDVEQLRAVERKALPATETRGQRFDLYRFEVREYISAPPQ